MKNLKLVILLVIIFVLGLSGIYYIYDLNINKKATATPTPSPSEKFPSASSSPSPSPTPSGGVSQTNIVTHPQSGSGDLSGEMEVRITRPSADQTVSSPLKLTGFVKKSDKITINFKDAEQKMLASNEFTCAENICYFESILNFEKPQSSNGIIEVKNAAGYTHSVGVRL